jgi:hypothetical protein
LKVTAREKAFLFGKGIVPRKRYFDVGLVDGKARLYALELLIISMEIGDATLRDVTQNRVFSEIFQDTKIIRKAGWFLRVILLYI